MSKYGLSSAPASVNAHDDSTAVQSESDLSELDIESQEKNIYADDANELYESLASPENLERLASLSKIMSDKTADEVFESMDEEEFNLHRRLQGILLKHQEQGIRQRSVGIVFKDLTAKGVDQGMLSEL